MQSPKNCMLKRFHLPDISIKSGKKALSTLGRDDLSILVIGHGPIGHSFIEKMSAESSGCQISVLCEEPRPAYNRVMLTQYFEDRDAEKHDKMKLSYVTEEELKELKVNLLYGRAMSIDREAKKVSYASQKGAETQTVVGYDILVLATGSFCFVPPVPGMTIPEKKM